MDPVQWLSRGDAGRRLTKFVSVMPYLEESTDIKRAFLDILGPIRTELPWQIRSLFMAERASSRLLAYLLDKGLHLTSGRFIAGNGLKSTKRTIRKYEFLGLLTNLDILGERVLSTAEAEHFVDAYTELIADIGTKKGFSISIKLSAFHSQAHVTCPEHSARKIIAVLKPLFGRIQAFGGHVYLDAEEYEFQEIHWLVFRGLYNMYGSTVRFVLQAYLRNSHEMLMRLARISSPQDPVWIRLVRGAYWDYEVFSAELLNWRRAPVFCQKSDTDIQYSKLLELGAREPLYIVPATHNVNSILEAERVAGDRIPEYQFLYGMGEQIGLRLVPKNIPVRIYMPIVYPKGDTMPAIAYLVRRLVENRSQMSFLVEHSGARFQKELDRLSGIAERRIRS